MPIVNLYLLVINSNRQGIFSRVLKMSLRNFSKSGLYDAISTIDFHRLITFVDGDLNFAKKKM